jgi:hypothetical protein
MYFPWVGMLEQVRLADVFVHYDEVQFDRGFYNRVQVKTPQGPRWITVPLSNHRRGQKIAEIAVDDGQSWRRSHRDVLAQSYRGAPFLKDMLGVVDAVLASPHRTLGEVSRASLLALIDYFELRGARRFHDSAEFFGTGSASERLLGIVRAVAGDTYITGHGARNYLDHELFERTGVKVSYMNYRLTPYPQLHGAFTPYVTALDLIANCGKQGAALIASPAVDWREFVARPG